MTGTLTASFTTPPLPPVMPALSEAEERWFDAVDYQQADEHWFDASDAEPIAGQAAVPLDEDCRRCLQQLITTLGTIKQSELLSSVLNQLLPGISGELVALAGSLYQAVIRRENIDIAALNVLGVASGWLLSDGNIIARTASWLRDSVLEYSSTLFPETDADSDANPTVAATFTALAVAAVVARYLIADAPPPQRRALRLPGYFARLLLRASHYWHQLGRIAQPAPALSAAYQPAFALDSRTQFTMPALPTAEGTALTLPARRQLSAFSANGTLCPERLLRATVAPEPVPDVISVPADIAVRLHQQAIRHMRQAAGVTSLEACITRKSEQRWRAGNTLISETQLSTRCDATRAVASPITPQLPAVPSDETANIGAVSAGWHSITHPLSGLLAASDPLRFPEAMASDLPVDPGLWQHIMRNSEPGRTPVRSASGDPLNERIARWLAADSPASTGQGHETLIAGVVSHLQEQGVEKQLELARLILAAQESYGGNAAEVLDDSRTRAIIRQWLFQNLVGMPLAEYLALKVAATSRALTAGELPALLEINNMLSSGGFDYRHIPQPQRDSFCTACEGYLREELPFVYHLSQQPEIKDLALTDYRFGVFFSAASYLAEINALDKFNQQEMHTIGQWLCDEAISEGGPLRALPWLAVPAALFIARTAPEKITPFRRSGLFREQALVEYVNFWEAAHQQAQRFSAALDAYRSAAADWRTKTDLADELIAQCPPEALMYLPDKADAYLDAEQRAAKRRANARELYLTNMRPPCNSVPPALEPAYRRRTEKVADAFRELDNYLITAALRGVPKAEQRFLFSPEAVFRAVAFSMQTNKSPRYLNGGWIYPKDIVVSLDRTELFAVSVGRQERIYGLQALDNPLAGYRLHRLDKNIHNYIKHKVLSYKEFGEDYHVSGNRVTVKTHQRPDIWGNRRPDHEFTFSVAPLRDEIIQTGPAQKPLIARLQDRHRERFFQTLYQSGEATSKSEKVWEAARGLIPFYDCVDGSIEKDPGRAVPACFLDVLALIPVVGQAASLTLKTGAGLYRGLRTGGLALHQGASLAAAGRAGLQHISLPTVRELAALGKGVLRAFDPGFEWLAGSGRATTRRILAGPAAEPEAAALAEKLSGLAAAADDVPTQAGFTVRYTGNGLNVQVVAVGELNHRKLYAMLDPTTGQAFGKRYMLYGDELVALTPATRGQPVIVEIPDDLKPLVKEVKDYVKDVVAAGCPSARHPGRGRRCIPPELPERLDQLPSELLGEIFSYLTPDELLVLAGWSDRYEQEAMRVFCQLEKRARVTDMRATALVEKALHLRDEAREFSVQGQIAQAEARQQQAAALYKQAAAMREDAGLQIPGLPLRKTIMANALQNDRSDIIRALTSEYIVPPVDFLAQTTNGNTLLTECADYGGEKVMKLLLTMPGMDINHKTLLGNTPLLIAVFADNEPVVSLLLKQPGINVNAYNNNRESAINLAIRLGRDNIFRKLMAVPDIDVNAAGQFVDPPLIMAVKRRDKALIELLLQHPAIKVNAVNEFGLTPLMEAASQGDKAILKLLLQHPDIDIGKATNGGTTAYSIAVNFRHRDAARILKRAQHSAEARGRCRLS